MPEVKEQALAWLDKGGDLSVWQEENPALAVKREKVLGELRQKLNSPQPPQKKISQHRLYKCEWQIGDVFAYQFKGEYAKSHGFDQKYVYFIKVFSPFDRQEENKFFYFVVFNYIFFKIRDIILLKHTAFQPMVIQEVPRRIYFPFAIRR